MKKLTHLALAGVSLAALSQPLPVFAQQAPAADEDTSDVILVQARRRGEDVQDVPAVVNAVSADELSRLNLRRFEEVAAVVPGLTLSNNSNGIGSSSTLRGVKYDVNASGNNGTVEYYLNDAPLSASFVLQSMFDVGQIEVLRGPQGTLRGRASPSGSITVTTHAPDMDEVGGYVSFTGGTHGAINANAAIGIPLIDDVLAVRIAGLVDEGQGSRVQSVTNNINPSNRVRAGRISVRFDPLDSLSLNFMYQRLDQNIIGYDQSESVRLTNTEAGVVPTNPNAGSVLINGTDRLSAFTQPRDIDSSFEIYNWSANWEVAGQRLVYVGSITKQHLRSFQPTDMGDLFGPNYPSSVLQSYGQFTDTRANQESHEIRLQSDERLFDMFDYVVGGLMNTLTPETDLVTATPVFCSGVLPVPGVGNIPCAFTPFGNYPAPSAYVSQTFTSIAKYGRTRERSVFANLTAHIGDATEISGGVRYINFRNDDTLFIYSGVNSLTAFANNLTPSVRIPTNQEFNHWIYSGSIKHRFNESLMVYASIGSSWRPSATATGDFSVCSLNGTAFTIAPVLSCAAERAAQTTQPETSTSYELGVRTSWLDRRLTLNATVFHQDYNNFVYRAPGNGAPYVNYSRNSVAGAFFRTVGSFNFISGVPVKVDGIEVEAAYRASDNFNIGVSGTYARGRITNGLIPCADANRDGVPDASEALPTLANFDSLGQTLATCRVNMRANDAPLFTSTVQAEYSAPISGSTDIYGRGLFTYYGSSQQSPTNAFDDVSAYGILNAYVGLRDHDGGWDLQLYVKNLTNTERVLTRTTPLTTTVGLTSGQGTTEYTNYRTVTMTPPREFGLTLRYAFGAR